MKLRLDTRARRYAALAVAVTVAVIIAVWLWRPGRGDTETYREVKVDRGSIEVVILANGTVQPYNRLEIKPPIAGRIERLEVDEGYTVRKGQVLAWMSSTERAALIDAARARGPEEVKRWEEYYKATPIISPIDGVVIKRNAQQGQSFTANDAVLVLSDRLIVEAQVDETDIAQIKLKQKANIVLDAYPGKPIPAEVGMIHYEATIVSNVTTYAVDVLPAKVPPFMRSGMTATVSFIAAAKQDVVRVPARVLREREGRSVVLVQAENGVREERVVQTGLSDGKFTEIVAGLREGETVLAVQVKLDKSGTGTSNPFATFGRPSSKK